MSEVLVSAQGLLDAVDEITAIACDLVYESTGSQMIGLSALALYSTVSRRLWLYLVQDNGQGDPRMLARLSVGYDGPTITCKQAARALVDAALGDGL